MVSGRNGSALHTQGGAVFLTTLVCLLLATASAAGLYALTSQQSHLMTRMDRAQRALSLAESGLSAAISTLYTDYDSSSNAANFPLTSLGGGQYDATVTVSGGRTLVSSVGTYEGVQRSVSAEVVPPADSAFDYALASGGEVDWDPGTGGSTGTLNGDIYAEGDVSVDGTVNGDIYTSSGSISGTNSGSQTTGAGAVTFPVVDSSYYQAIAQANGYYYSSDTTFSSGSPIPSAPTGGVIFVSGNITITGDHATQACIFATGNVTITNSGNDRPNTTIQQYSTYPALVALGNITINSTGNASQGGSFEADGLVYAGGDFHITGNHYDNPRVEINGTIIARGDLKSETTSWTTLNLNYVKQAPPGFDVGNSTLQIASYNT